MTSARARVQALEPVIGVAASCPGPISPSQGAARGTGGPTPDLKAGNLTRVPGCRWCRYRKRSVPPGTPFPWTPGLAHLVPGVAGGLGVGIFPDLTPYQQSWGFPALMLKS